MRSLGADGTRGTCRAFQSKLDADFHQPEDRFVHDARKPCSQRFQVLSIASIPKQGQHEFLDVGRRRKTLPIEIGQALYPIKRRRDEAAAYGCGKSLRDASNRTAL